MRSGHFLQKLLNYWTGQVRPREQIMNVYRVKLSGYYVQYSDIAHFLGYSAYSDFIQSSNSSLDIKVLLFSDVTTSVTKGLCFIKIFKKPD